MIWEKTQLSDLFRVGSSKRVLQSQWKSEGIPFYRGREITRLSADGFVDNELFISEEHYEEVAAKYGVPSEGDIVITAIGTIGNTHVVRATDQFYFKDASVLWLKKVAHVSSDFINLWLKSPIFFSQLDKGKGATVDTLTIQKLQSVQISLPSLPEQQRIVSILDEAFAGIAKATANAEKNLANARELFESYLQSVFDNKGRDWEEKRLGEVSDLLDCLHKTPKYVDSGFPMVRVTDVKKGYLNLSRTKQVDKMTFDAFSKKYTPKIGDIVFSRVGSYGVSSLVNSNDPFCLGQNTVFIIPKIHPTFLYYFLNSSIAKLQYDELVEGVTQPTISMKSIRAVSLFVPPSMEEQSTLAQKIDELSTETKRLEAIYQQKLVALEELKKSILNQAFSGQLQ